MTRRSRTRRWLSRCSSPPRSPAPPNSVSVPTSSPDTPSVRSRQHSSRASSLPPMPCGSCQGACRQAWPPLPPPRPPVCPLSSADSPKTCSPQSKPPVPALPMSTAVDRPSPPVPSLRSQTLSENPPERARVIALPVAGAFHTEFMAAATEDLATTASALEVSDPQVSHPQQFRRQRCRRRPRIRRPPRQAGHEPGPLGPVPGDPARTPESPE